MPTVVEPIRWPAVQAAIRKVMADRGLTLGRLSAEMGMSRTTLKSAITDRTETQWNTAVAILSALGLSLRWVQANAKAKP